MKGHKIYFLIISVFVFSSLLMFSTPVSADEDTATSIKRSEGRGWEEKNKSDDEKKNENTTASLRREDDDDEEDNESTGTPKNERGESESERHRSTVATFVQNLLKMTEKRKDGIGEQVREIAKSQEDDATSTAKAIKETEERSRFKTFLIGTDYKNIGAIRSAIVKTRNEIGKLNRVIESLPTSTEKTDFENQIKTLEQQQTKLNDFVKTKESSFSLFGWFVKLFY